MNTTASSPPVASSAGFSLFDVVYEDRIHCPRSLIVEIISPTSVIVLTEGDGQGYHNPQHFMTQAQWLEWFARFEDELTGKEYREAKAHAMTPVVWSRAWNEFKHRYDTTGNAFLD